MFTGMFATIFILTIVTASMAVPTNRVRQEMDNPCGPNESVSCCLAESGNGNNGGALSGLLGGGLLGECTKLDVALPIGVRDLLDDDNCNGQLACCTDDNNGVIRFALFFNIRLTDCTVLGH